MSYSGRAEETVFCGQADEIPYDIQTIDEQKETIKHKLVESVIKGLL